MLRGRRSVFVLLSVTTLALGAIVVACSEGNPPAASEGADGTHFETVDSGSGRETGPTTDGDAGDAGDAAADADLGSCLGDVAVDAGDGGTTCAGDCASHCVAIGKNYRVGVAETAVACVRALGSCSDVTQVRSCVDLALERACPSPTATGYCTPLVTACDPNAGGDGSNISERGCESYASALSPTGRGVFSGCIAKQVDAGTCAAGIIDCAEAIRE